MIGSVIKPLLLKSVKMTNKDLETNIVQYSMRKPIRQYVSRVNKHDKSHDEVKKLPALAKVLNMIWKLELLYITIRFYNLVVEVFSSDIYYG